MKFTDQIEKLTGITKPEQDATMKCIICDLPIYRRGFSIAMLEGDPVPNDWKGDWAGFECCESCYEAHQRWQHDPEAVRDWINSVRRPTQPMNAS